MLRAKDVGPELAELLIIADGGTAIDYMALRDVPARRLAYTAAQALERLGEHTAAQQLERFSDVIYTDDRSVVRGHSSSAAFSRRESPTARVYLAAALAQRALAVGLPIRATVADKMGVSKRTVDRYLAQAKADGLIDDKPLSRRPPPRQRDTL